MGGPYLHADCVVNLARVSHRLVIGAVLTALTIAAAPALGHPGHGPRGVEVGDDFFRSNDLRAMTGDTVVWTWLGPSGDHSVRSDPGQAESFDSDPGKPTGIVHPAGFAFSHRFTHAGVFTYRCRVHAAMTGTVTVVALAARDSVRPVIRSASVRPSRVCADSAPGCRVTRAYLHVRMSERSTVVARIERAVRGRWKLTRTLDFDAAKGRDRHRLHVRGFDPGPYRARLVAYDAVGNRSRGRQVRFRVAVGKPG
jgi:plastocyanin